MRAQRLSRILGMLLIVSTLWLDTVIPNEQNRADMFRAYPTTECVAGELGAGACEEMPKEEASFTILFLISIVFIAGGLWMLDYGLKPQPCKCQESQSAEVNGYKIVDGTRDELSRLRKKKSSEWT
ncbi:MAG: hypothetical protein JWL80_196 [Parcubacteria group bacterium]|nr:hypothetical protein [Parcubacteria group bacterium]